MASITHGVKKRMSLMMTRKKTIEKNINAEYTTLKHAILRQKDTLENAVDFVKKKAHVAFADNYLHFSELLMNDTPVDSTMYDSVRDANEASKKIHTDANTPYSIEDAPARLIANVEAYINELKTVSKEFASVEKGFVETERYERKVGKLANKTASADKGEKGENKVSEKTRRNMDKMDVERAAFNAKLQSVIDMMKKSNAKYEKMLQCVHSAFWLSEDTFLSTTESTTKAIREKCKENEESLVSIDVTKL